MEATFPAPHQSLRPLSLGEILDQAIRLYRRNFFKFIGIIAVVQVPITLLQLIFSFLTSSSLVEMATGAPSSPGEIFTPQYFAGMGGSLLTVFLSLLLVQGIATAALTRSIANSRLGTPTDIIGSYTSIGSSWLRLVGSILLWILILVLLVIWTIVPCIGWISGPGMLTFVAGVVGPLIPAIIVLENKGATAALRRAWDLSRRRFWWLVGFVFILMLFNYLIVQLPAGAIAYVIGLVMGQSSMAPSDTLMLNTIIQGIGTLFFSLIYLPLQLTAMTLVYFDLRVRTEGLDLALQTTSPDERSGMELLISQAPPPAEDNLVTGNELGYFVILSLVYVVLYMIVMGLVMLAVMLFASMAG